MEISKTVTERNSLQELLKQNAILFSKNNIKIVDKRGAPLNWIYYHWGVSLTFEGSFLTARCILEILKRFESTQLVSYGMTSIPIVSSCILLSNNQYTGLAIRKIREAHGTCNQIEGLGNKNKKVIIIDDCISSGTSVCAAIKILEDEGYIVEGCICVVNMTWSGGSILLKSLGYEFESIFELWKDLMTPPQPQIPAYKFLTPISNATYYIPNGLTPADASRLIIDYYLKTGTVPNPPMEFDRHYDGNGGIFISLRDRKNNFRIARDGFINIDPSEANLTRDVLLASFKIISKYRENIKRYGWENLKVGVYLLGEQEKIAPSELDFLKYGITIVSDVQPWKMGAAMPNTQSFISEIEQYMHACYSNTGLSLGEPHTLFRHTITRSIETGEGWQQFGIESKKNELANILTGSLLIRYVYDVIGNLLYGNPIGELKFDSKIPIYGFGVSLYYEEFHGMIGCWTSISDTKLDLALYKATVGAWTDSRYNHSRKDIDIKKLTVVVSTFVSCELLGKMESKTASRIFRLGLDTITAHNDDLQQNGIILSYIPCQYNWSKEQTTDALLKKASISEKSCYWKTYETNCWISQKNEIKFLRNGFPEKNKSEITYALCLSNIETISKYILKQFMGTHLPKYCYWPLDNRWSTNEDCLRIILSLGALFDSGIFLKNKKIEDTATKALEYCCDFIKTVSNDIKLLVPNIDCSKTVEHHLLLAIAKNELPNILAATYAESLVKKVSSFFDDDGSICDLPLGKRLRSDQDFLPGVALLAISNYSRFTSNDIHLTHLDKTLEFYRKKFQLAHSWGLAWWHMQAWTSIFLLKKEDKYADFVFELADWALSHQLKSGAFLVNYSENGPSFHTACVLEGIADAWSTAINKKDEQRAEKYSTAWKNGIKFMNDLIVSSDDTFFMPEPFNAIGGVRYSPTSSMMRIDFSAHLLRALIKGTLLLNK